MIRIFLLILALGSAEVFASTVYLTRHYEKATGQDPQLTDVGAKRAQALAALLKTKPVEHIVSTQYQRTIQTVTPLADSLNKRIDVYSPSPEGLSALAAAIRNANSDYVVAGHSNTTPALIKLLGGPDIHIDENDYGTLFILRINQSDVTFDSIAVALPEESVALQTPL